MGVERTRTEKGSSTVPCGSAGFVGSKRICTNSQRFFCYLAPLVCRILVHRTKLRLDVVLILGEFGRQMGHLNDCNPGHDPQHREAQDSRHQHGRDTAQPPAFKPVTDWHQQEAQQHGERQWNQETLRHVKSRNDNGGRRHRRYPRLFSEFVRACHWILYSAARYCSFILTLIYPAAAVSHWKRCGPRLIRRSQSP